MTGTARAGVGAAAGAAGLGLAWAYVFSGAADPGVLDRTGPVVLWGLPLAKLAFNAAAAAVIGALVLALVALPVQTSAYLRLIRLAAVSAAAWVAASAASALLTFSSMANLPLSAPELWPSFRTFLTGVEPGRAAVLSGAAAAAVLLLCCLSISRPAWRRRADVAALGIAFAGLYPLVSNSHAAGIGGHGDTTMSMMLHVGAAAVWLGGLLALLVIRTAAPPEVLETAVRRYSTLALVAFIALAVSGAGAAWAGIGGWAGLFTPYGGILAAKTGALVALGGFGVLHRRRLSGRLHRQPNRSGRLFVNLAAAELVVMGAASGLAAALGRTEPPVSGSGPAGLPAPDAAAYLTEWDIQPLWALICVFGAVWYLAGVRRVHLTGGSWLVSRTSAWLAAMAVLFGVTNGGLQAYQGVLFGPHVLAQMLLTAVVPLLLVYGAPLTLIERSVPARQDGSLGAREAVAAAVRPVVAAGAAAPYLPAVVLAGALALFYYTPLLEWSALTQAGYSVMAVTALATGCLFSAAVLGGPAAAARNDRLAAIAAAATLYGVYGYALLVQAAAFERSWVPAAGSPGAPDPAAPAELGGLAMLAVAAGTLLVLAVLVLTDAGHPGTRGPAPAAAGARTGTPGAAETAGAAPGADTAPGGQGAAIRTARRQEA